MQDKIVILSTYGCASFVMVYALIAIIEAVEVEPLATAGFLEDGGDSDRDGDSLRLPALFAVVAICKPSVFVSRLACSLCIPESLMLDSSLVG